MVNSIVYSNLLFLDIFLSKPFLYVYNRIMNSPESQSNSLADNDADILNDMPSFEQWRAEQAKGQAEVDPEKLELFNRFVDFFEKDSNIKNTLTELAPSEQDFYNSDRVVRYADKLYEGTMGVIGDVRDIMKNFYVSDAIEDRLKQIEEDVVNAGASSDKLAQVYKKDFSAMSEEFNKGVHEEIVGYSLFGNPHKFDTKASSINEILHLIHSSIVNNESVLQSLPIIEKAGDLYDSITLYGTADSENPVARGIYDRLKNGDESCSDIVSLKDRTLMMIRDRGHALTVDIEKDPKDGKFYINYFVPKICNVDKVNRLPGVRRITKKEGVVQVREFTTGVFSVENEADVANAVINFVDMVPTDGDIVREKTSPLYRFRKK